MEEKEPTVLAVDDTEDNLDLLEFSLKRKPVRLLRATSGRECLDLAATQNPDIILLDIQMPEMDGFETFRRLRSNNATSKIPVVFLTAKKKDATSIEEGLMMGAEEYLVKPIDTEELLVRIRTLVRLKRMEAELEKTKADFMAMLVHDLRSPLIGIKGVIDFLKEQMSDKRPFGPDHLELLVSAQTSAMVMLGLINNILDLSKYEAGNIHLSRGSYSINDLIQTAAHQMNLRFHQKGIHFEAKLDPNLPLADVDEQKIMQVVTNLLTNAFKFTPPKGTVQVTSSLAAATTDGGQFLEISISDTGVGIPADELDQVFKRYKQVSSAKYARETGTGLGLAICDLIVKSHGGTIGVRSDPGKLTVFTFTLPTAKTK